MNQITKTLLICVATLLALGASDQAMAQNMVVIVNKDNPVSSMKQIEVKLYYMRKIKQEWPALGIAVLPAGLSTSNPAKSTFLAEIMKMSASELDAYFKQRQFANAEPLPATFSSETELIEYVSKNKGAIAYVSKGAFDSFGNGVKSVLTQ